MREKELKTQKMGFAPGLESGFEILSYNARGSTLAIFPPRLC